jgi:signal transduction histidine kinase
MKSERLRFAVLNFTITAIYVAGAKLGLTLAFVAEQVTVVWPPTGIALSAVLLFGYRIWPAIALGAFIANITTNTPVITSLCIATGNTFEALVGGWLLNRIVGFRFSMERFRDVVGLIILGAMVSTTVSATIGVTSLCLTGMQSWQRFGSLWGVWFLGDGMGDVLVAPMILTFAAKESRRRIPARGVPEFLALLIIFTAFNMLLFGRAGLLGTPYHPPDYAIFPFLIWAALRFGTCGTAISVFVTATVAVLGTVNGYGPFTTGGVNENLISLQLFMFVAAVTALLMAVSETNREIAEDLLRQADRRKNEFLAMLAHELRNPLAPIRNAAEVIRMCRADPGRLEWAYNVMVRQIGHMSRLIEDLLDIARITRGLIKLNRVATDLNEMVKRSVDAAHSIISSKGLHLQTQFFRGPVSISADITRMEQVISNLLNNAAKFTDAGGTISVQTERSDAWAVLRVRDTGRGMSADLLPHVFDLFTQGGRSLDRSEGGLGIGLTLVQNLVRMHGGNVEAKSKGVGLGSEFIVRLPALPTAPALSDQTSGTAATTASKRILIIEDNVDAADSLALMFQMMGHDAHTAYDGASGLKDFELLNPSIVVLDIGLPGMDGWEVARRLRSNRPNNHVKIIVLSGYGSDSDRERSRNAGIDHHLVKPPDFEALGKLVKE